MPSTAPHPAATRPLPAPRKDPTLLHAHAAMASMLEHGLSPTPANYLVWFSFHGDSAPGLRAELERRLAGQPRMTQGMMEELHLQFFTADHEAVSLREVAARLEVAVHEAIGLVQDTREDALRYGGTLAQATDRLGAEPESLNTLLRRLAAETLEVSRRSEAAARNLAETARKTQELRDELAEARRLAGTDPLTGLANRRHFDKALREQLAGQRPTALVMVDLDHFKAVNDTHGHPAGDQVLCWLADILAEAAPGDAVAARFGGEEFSLMLPCGQLRDAMAMAEQIRGRIAQATVELAGDGAHISVTASFGVAMAQPGERPAQLIARADAALYEAKRGGRNRVCADQPLPKAESVWN
ncbi:GGDEF domain-containing protein [Sediminicoccus sp. BL-A-41-H5]|uniref:GGDEF domain-containing protein n=1 Tax=Sediminicoccus sp. BL-A-41-H5 TaxID=3421106 RepID=UPI003D66ACBF